jgi:hypothetical protein
MFGLVSVATLGLAARITLLTYYPHSTDILPGSSSLLLLPCCELVSSRNRFALLSVRSVARVETVAFHLPSSYQFKPKGTNRTLNPSPPSFVTGITVITACS